MNNLSKKLPIGVFDSGVGGLTVLEDLIKELPNEDFIFVGDQGHCPYGTKTDEQIKKCITNIEHYLEKKHVKAIVIACNTASLFADDLRKITNIPILGVIDPTCEYAIKQTKNGNIAVLATNATIAHNTYQDRIKKAGFNPIGVPASEFVDFIEHYDHDDPKGLELVESKLSVLKDKNIDTLIHGCTHFSIIEDLMRKVLGDKIKYVACGYPTSLKLKEILESNDLLNEPHETHVKIYTTGSVKEANRSMKFFTAPHDRITHIEVEE